MGHRDNLGKDMFLSVVRKYTRARKLNQTMVNELIDHIEVHQAEKINGVWEQRLTIHYNVIGPIIIPEDIPLPAPDVTVNTRKGVWVNYVAAKKSDGAYRTNTVSSATLVRATGLEPAWFPTGT